MAPAKPAAPRTEILDRGTLVFTAPGAGFGTDALLLARFAPPRPGQRAADLCSGCGIVALAWHDGGHRGPCAAVELCAPASALCAAAVAANGPEAGHITPFCADLRAFALPGSPDGCAPLRGGFDLAACNPPYFTGGHPSQDAARALARHESGNSLTLPALAACAARLLRDGGRFALCQRPERLAEVCAALCAARLEPKRLMFVTSTDAGRPWLFLLEAQKNRRPGLRLEPDLCVAAGAALYGPGRAAPGGNVNGG